MADTKISALTALTGANLASTDEFVLVDKSDTTMAASGTNKRITTAELGVGLPLLDAAGNYAAATVEGALAEVREALDGHVVDEAGAHAASAVSVLDAGGNFTATEVEGVLVELAAQASAATGIIDHSETAVTVVNTVTETAIMTATIPVGFLADDRIRFRAVGDMLNNSGAPVDLTTRVKLNGTTVMASVALSVTQAVNRRSYVFEGVITLKDALNSQIISAFGMVGTNGTGTEIDAIATALTWVGYGTGAADFASSVTLTITIQWGTAAATIEIVNREFTVAALTSAPTLTFSNFVTKTGGGKETVATTNVTGAVVVDLATANVHVLSLTGNVTSVTIDNGTTGEACSGEIHWVQNASTAYTVAYGAAWKWHLSTADHVMSTALSARDRVAFETLDDGTTVYGDVIGQGYA